MLPDGETLTLQKFEACKQAFSGSVFLLASGASAENFPFKEFLNERFIAMNGSIAKCREHGIKPEFYICDDVNFIKGRPDLALEGVVEAKHIATGLDCLTELAKHDAAVLRDKKIYLLTRVNRYHHKPILSDWRFAWSIRKDRELKSSFSLIRSKPNRIGFSLNLGRGYFVGRTIPYAALQLSCHLGFNRVFLLA